MGAAEPYRAGSRVDWVTTLPVPRLAKQQPPDGNGSDEGGERERTGVHQNADHDLDRKNHHERQGGAEQHGNRDDRELKASHSGGAGTPTGFSEAGSGPDRGTISGCRQSVRCKNQPITSTIQKVSMGVSTTAATATQYCVSENFSIDVPREGYVNQTRRRNRAARLYSTLSVLLASSLASQTHPIAS